MRAPPSGTRASSPAGAYSTRSSLSMRPCLQKRKRSALSRAPTIWACSAPPNKPKPKGHLHIAHLRCVTEELAHNVAIQAPGSPPSSKRYVATSTVAHGPGVASPEASRQTSGSGLTTCTCDSIDTVTRPLRGSDRRKHAAGRAPDSTTRTPGEPSIHFLTDPRR
jgi:hypothetical protein